MQIHVENYFVSEAACVIWIGCDTAVWAGISIMTRDGGFGCRYLIMSQCILFYVYTSRKL